MRAPLGRTVKRISKLAYTLWLEAALLAQAAEGQSSLSVTACRLLVRKSVEVSRLAAGIRRMTQRSRLPERA
jgi:hypothetical protein